MLLLIVGVRFFVGIDWLSPRIDYEGSSYFLFKHRNALVHIIEILSMAAELFRDFRELLVLPLKLFLNEQIFLLPFCILRVKTFKSAVHVSTEWLESLLKCIVNFLTHEQAHRFQIIFRKGHSANCYIEGRYKSTRTNCDSNALPHDSFTSREKPF